MSLGEGLGLLGLGLGVKMESHTYNIVNNPTSEMDVESDTGPLLQIRFMKGGGKEICGGAVAGGSRFCIFLRCEGSTAFHTRSREGGEDLPGGK